MNLIKKELKKVQFLYDGIQAYRKRRKLILYKEVFEMTGLPKRPKRKVLVYPVRPSSWNAFRSVLNILNFELTHDLKDDFLFVIKWDNKTFKEKSDELLRLSKKIPVINLKSKDISKHHVDELIQEVFGYCTKVDPLTFQGRCVKKSNINSLHDGEIITCPIKEKQEGFIYQVLIDNQVEGKYVEDIRVPFFKDHIPFVYLKYKLIEHQFASKNQKVLMQKTEDVLSKGEVEKIVELAKKMELDFAEMDVLRDRSNNQVYVIDVNDTPGGLPKNSRGTDILSPGEKKEALYKMTMAFYNSFLKDIY